MAEAELVSAAESRYIRDGVAQDTRNDGRRRLQSRLFRACTGVVPQATGSAQVTLGRTLVMACVKAEIGRPDPAAPHLGRIQIAVDCSPTAAPEFQGRGGEELQAELASALQSSFGGGDAWASGPSGAHGDALPTPAPPEGGDSSSRRGGAHAALDLSRLVLMPGKTCWVLNLDALVLSLDGNALGALSLALKAALEDVVLPRVEIVMGEEGQEPELEVLDEEGGEEARLDTSGVPLIVQFCQIGKSQVLDPVAGEEAVASASVWVAVREDGRAAGAGLTGASGVSPAVMREILLSAGPAARSWHALLKEECEKAHEEAELE